MSLRFSFLWQNAASNLLLIKKIMKIAILALQGAFAEHQQMLLKLSVESVQIRNLDDWTQYVTACGGRGAGLIIPGGESTAMTRIIRDEHLFDPIREAILAGMPVFGTCAGLIMLDSEHLGTMDIKVRRNAYGRQLGSFVTMGNFTTTQPHTFTPSHLHIPMTFIRAPYIESVGPGVEVLAVVDGHIVAARQGNQLVTSFHPELDSDTTVHQLFLSLVSGDCH